MNNLILLRGGGDLASGVALRLHRAGIRVLITELSQPLAVRRTVSFAQAVYQGEMTIEGITARRVNSLAHASEILQSGAIPVLIDPPAETLNLQLSTFNFPALVDARLTKRPPDLSINAAPLVIGLGPGFIPGQNCHAAVETKRGHTLGRVYWDAAPEADTGLPEGDPARVLRAPTEGILQTFVEIGARVTGGQPIAEVDGHSIVAPFAGVLRGLLHPGLPVKCGMKIGDVDPRNDPAYCFQVSDKALAIGGGVLEAILSRKEMRTLLWT
ncbi:MAG: selenium-dependent molybdenum cofactor biosynthesis protein YqeB [Anaerolineales bacterium]